MCLLPQRKKHGRNPEASTVMAILSNENTFLQRYVTDWGYLIDPALRLYEIDILILSMYSQPFMDILAEWRNLGASHLVECTKEELAMNGGAASYAERAPSDPSSRMNHLDIDYQKLQLRKQNRFYQKGTDTLATQ